jgi:hypothetical protein
MLPWELCKLGVEPVACVTIRDRDGRPFVHVTEAKTLFGAVAEAITWFADPYWHGPKPRRDTVYEVSLVGDERTWKVLGANVARLRRTRPRAGLTYLPLRRPTVGFFR